jgi:hypothetical protein
MAGRARHSQHVYEALDALAGEFGKLVILYLTSLRIEMIICRDISKGKPSCRILLPAGLDSEDASHWNRAWSWIGWEAMPRLLEPPPAGSVKEIP